MQADLIITNKNFKKVLNYVLTFKSKGLFSSFLKKEWAYAKKRYADNKPICDYKTPRHYMISEGFKIAMREFKRYLKQVKLIANCYIGLTVSELNRYFNPKFFPKCDYITHEISSIIHEDFIQQTAKYGNE